ncbi:MAG: non-homologous end-joining DNA ligase [Myxococcota bacterium]
MPKKTRTLELDGHVVTVSNPDKVYFPDAGITKGDLVDYYVAVAAGALGGVRGRPMALKRYPDGIEGEFFFQKRAPQNRPPWVNVTELSFPSGRTACEIVVENAAALAWVVNLGCIDLNPHPVRAADRDHPDELRIDLDPVPGVPWSQIRDVALVTRDVLVEHGLTPYVKTSGSRGMHIYARLHPRWGFTDVRFAALAVAREVEKRMPGRATSKWWKEEREGVFLDYNQNAKDRTMASVYAVRPKPDGRVSTPLRWEEVPTCDPGAFTLRTVPARFRAEGDPWADMDAHPGALDELLALHAAQGQGEAPYPPQYARAPGEPPRVQPSRAKRPGPLLTIGQSTSKEDALAGLERWKARHPEAAAHLAEKDVLVDAMRGRYTLWTRVRVNLAGVPEALRPPQEALDPDAPPEGYDGATRVREKMDVSS